MPVSLLVCAVVLDLVLGDPHGRPHPVRWIGALVRYGERPVRRLMPSARWAGGVMALGVTIVAGGVAALALRLAGMAHPLLEAAVAVVIVYACLGARDLSDHAVAVLRALRRGNCREARRRVGMMVSRDTGALDSKGVSRAAIESVAENLVDGAFAPLFFAALLGPVGAVVYKAVSTMDSMIGKRTKPYREFGTVAARCDDVFNVFPARFGFLIIALAAPLTGLSGRGALRIGWRDRNRHDSPNSAWSEAAFAGALGVRLGGADYYGGKRVSHPVLGEGAPPDDSHLAAALRLMWVSYLLAVVSCAGVYFINRV